MNKKTKILIVDDHPAVRSTMVDVLNEEGFITDKAQNGEIALQKCLSEIYDFVLIDVQMPKVNGIEVFQKLKEQKKQTPQFIFFTAYSLPEMKNEALKLGCLAFLQKPIQIEKVISLIRKSKRTTVLIYLKNKRQSSELSKSLISRGFHSIEAVNIDTTLIQLRQINFNYLIFDSDCPESEHDLVKATIKSSKSDTIFIETNEDETVESIEKFLQSSIIQKS